MDQTWLSGHKFVAISDTIYLLQVGLKSAPKLDVHINVSFETSLLQRCDLHGTIRLFEDADVLRKGNDRNAVARAIWVYANRTWRSPVDKTLWAKDAGLTSTELVTAGRELATLVKEWEYEIGKADCEVLQVDTSTASKI